MSDMKEIATSQYDFAVLREGDRCVYVDKTDILAKLALRQDAHYFISRPRRFGKSLMLSTLRYMFEGRRDLFRGLKIERTKWDWSKTYPVVMLNMSEIGGDTPEDIESGLYSLACGGGQRNCSPSANQAIKQSNNQTTTLVGIKFDSKIKKIDVPKFEPL